MKGDPKFCSRFLARDTSQTQKLSSNYSYVYYKKKKKQNKAKQGVCIQVTFSVLSTVPTTSLGSCALHHRGKKSFRAAPNHPEKFSSTQGPWIAGVVLCGACGLFCYFQPTRAQEVGHPDQLRLHKARRLSLQPPGLELPE